MTPKRLIDTQPPQLPHQFNNFVDEGTKLPLIWPGLFEPFRIHEEFHPSVYLLRSRGSRDMETYYVNPDMVGKLGGARPYTLFLGALMDGSHFLAPFPTLTDHSDPWLDVLLAAFATAREYWVKFLSAEPLTYEVMGSEAHKCFVPRWPEDMTAAGLIQSAFENDHIVVSYNRP